MNTGLNSDTLVGALNGDLDFGANTGVSVNLTGITETTALATLNNGAGVGSAAGKDGRYQVPFLCVLFRTTQAQGPDCSGAAQRGRFPDRGIP